MYSNNVFGNREFPTLKTSKIRDFWESGRLVPWYVPVVGLSPIFKSLQDIIRTEIL